MLKCGLLALCLSLCLTSTLACPPSSGHDGFHRRSQEERRHMPRSDDQLRDLEWGDLNILHTTDIHGWYQGHRKASPPEPNYSGDWGDWASFASKIKHKSTHQGRDLLLVDTGDLHDGNGLSDGFPPLNKDEPGGDAAVDGHVSNKLFSMVEYDLLAVGNHELYNYTVARDVYDHFRPLWGDRYLASNVNISINDTMVPLGSRSCTLVTPHHGFKIVSFGILFNFKMAAPGIHVQPPEEIANEKWFHQSLDAAEKSGVDAFVVLGHMPINGDPGWDAVHTKIRQRFPTTPIAILGGHSHIRDCRMMDDQTMALESGRYLETVGFMGIQNLTQRKQVGNGKVRFTRKYIDANPRNYAHHLELAQPADLLTPKGKLIRFLMNSISQAWNLTRLYGFAPKDYYLDRVAYGHNDSLLTLLTEEVLPKVVRTSEPSRQDKQSIILVNSGGQRFDLHAGPFTKNDQYIVSPFKDSFLYLPDVPWGLAKNLLNGLNTHMKGKGLVKVARDGTETPVDVSKQYSSGFIDDIFARWKQSQWFDFLQTQQQVHVKERTGGAKRRLDDVNHSGISATRDDQSPSLGYRTIDQCEGDGDDTFHTPIPFDPHQPEYIASNPHPLPESDHHFVDVVFIEFLTSPILSLLNRFNKDSNKTYSHQQLLSWGNVTTQQMYPKYALLAWQPVNGSDAAIQEHTSQADQNGHPVIPLDFSFNSSSDPLKYVLFPLPPSRPSFTIQP